MTDLVHDLGLGDTLVSNETGQAFVYDGARFIQFQGLYHGYPYGNDAFCESNAHFLVW